MKTITRSLLLLLLLTLNVKADLFPSATNQPAMGTNVIVSLIASNLTVYHNLVLSNDLSIFSAKTNNLIGYNQFDGTNIFNGSNIFNNVNILSGTNTFNGTNIFNGDVQHVNTNSYSPLALIIANVTNFNIVGALNMSFTFTNQFYTNSVLAGRTNTLYYTNGFLVRFTTP